MNKRRDFFRALAGTSLTTLFPFFSHGNVDSKLEKVIPLKPTRLRKGQTIGLIAPGYAINENILEGTKKVLKRLGFKSYHTNRILGQHGYFSNTDIERAKDLNEMFANPQIDGVLCVRGGYGCTRIMNLIDYDLIKANGKVFIGFSDVTALLNGIHQETGLITFHGPVGSTLDDPYTISQLEKIVMYPNKNVVIRNTLWGERYKYKPEYDKYTITPGSATGILAGGSLSLIISLIGTPHEIDFTDKIACIEDVDEAPYRMDRMLTQLIEGKTFKNAKGILFGVCSGCNESTNPRSFSLRQVILDRIKPLGIPACYGMSFGHIKNNFTFPIGHKALLDADKLTLTLSEKAVL